MHNIKINVEEAINSLTWIVDIELDSLRAVSVSRFSVPHPTAVGLGVAGRHNVDSLFKWWVSRNLVLIYNIMYESFI